jgi:diguanylate cyclase (GGDEF)-like protein
MRLATITNWAYGVTVGLALVSGGAMLLASDAQEQERAAVAQRYALDQMASSTVDDEQRLSGYARQYAISGSPADLAIYERERSRLAAVEGRLRKARDRGAAADELAALKDGIIVMDELQDEQQAAIAARKRGDGAQALAVLFGPQYEAELDRADSLFEKFEYRLDQRTAADIAEATRVARLWKSLSEGVLGVTAFLFLCVLYFVFRKRVLQPVVKLSDVVTRLAAQDYAAVPPQLDQIDEIGDMAQAIRIFRENGLERQRLEQERDVDRRLRDLLARMTQRMQASDTLDDLKGVITRFIPEIAPTYAGRLYLLDERRQVMAEACAWSQPLHSRPEFSPLACWGLRRGVPHRPAGPHTDVPCDHLHRDRPADIDTICLPLIAQRETLGLLYLELRADRVGEGATAEVYLTMLGENVALAIANLRLREALQTMAMADPLTGLANRRQLDRVLALQLARAESKDAPLSCAMLDVDHFKRFNDDFGHDAGDAVLRAVGELLNRSTREDLLAFRFGGEEFLLLMPDLAATQARARVEEIRAAIRALEVQHNGRTLGPVTVSMGVASTPDICAPSQLVETADAALLRAKRAGRDRVVIADVRRGRDVA